MHNASISCLDSITDAPIKLVFLCWAKQPYNLPTCRRGGQHAAPSARQVQSGLFTLHPSSSSSSTSGTSWLCKLRRKRGGGGGPPLHTQQCNHSVQSSVMRKHGSQHGCCSRHVTLHGRPALLQYCQGLGPWDLLVQFLQCPLDIRKARLLHRGPLQPTPAHVLFAYSHVAPTQVPPSASARCCILGSSPCRGSVVLRGHPC